MKTFFTNSQEIDRLKERLHSLGGSVNGMVQVKLGRPLLKVLIMIPRVIGLKDNLSMVKVLITFSRLCYDLAKKGGIRFLVIYLKSCHTLLQQSVAGQRLANTAPLGARVSRTRRGGLPRCIPKLHRIRIRAGDFLCIKFWLSLFSLYRVLDIRGKLNLKTITAFSTANMLLLAEYSAFVCQSFWTWIRDRWSQDGSVTDALHEGALEFLKGLRAKPFLIFRSSPVLSSQDRVRLVSTSPVAILLSTRVWKEFWDLPLGLALRAWCQMTGNIWVLNRIESWSQGVRDPRSGNLVVSKKGEVLSSATPGVLAKGARQLGSTWNHWLGKLGFKVEAAGKVRVFAMVDCFTQWLMEPLHKAIFQTLRVIPQDGTFDQLKPIRRVLKRQSELRSGGYTPGQRLPLMGSWPWLKTKRRTTWALFSFDLSAATDRLPLVFQKVLLSPILGAWGAETWGNLLVAREYLVNKRKDGFTAPNASLLYGSGQPMGALSSWALLAIFHHSIVQWAWYRVCVKYGWTWSWYEDYAVLGDDIVILGRDVAMEYRSLMDDLGVTIGDHKSMVSLYGDGLEFAKRTFLKGEDVSAVPLPELLVARHSLSASLELVKKYNLTLGAYTKFLGFGYKARGRMNAHLQTLSKRLRNYVVAFKSPGMPGSLGLLGWLSMRSIFSQYVISESRLSRLLTQFWEREKRELLERLDSLQPFLAKAKELGTVYRDREHYGTTERGPDRIYRHDDLTAAVAPTVVDSLNETVYREGYLDVVCDARDLRAKVEELDPQSLEGIEALWDSVRAIEQDLGALPLPKSLITSSKLKTLGDMISDVKRWEMYSRVFRTKDIG